jgi:hypothetical protein
MLLYRPVGKKEYELVAESGFKTFPPRLPQQPIFYPVLNQEYAEQIAKDWNTKDENSGFVGIVLKFVVNDDYIKRFEPHIVGSRMHAEYWIPAEQLDEFNQNIIGKVEVVSEFR